MLLAAPYASYEAPVSSGASKKHGPPRIISEIRKVSPVKPREQIRPRISGDLLVICADEKRWCPRRVVVRGGQLLVGSGDGSSSGAFRLPLRHLSLAAGPLPNSLALYKGRSIILTIQTASERAFELWVKTIAIELIRQTPLEAVRYLDILDITEQQRSTTNMTVEKSDLRKDCNHNSVVSRPWDVTTVQPIAFPSSYLQSPPSPVAINISPSSSSGSSSFPRNRQQSPSGGNKDDSDRKVAVDEVNVEVLLKKCQNSDNYVPVREKLVLFESLCRLGRKVRSSEDVSYKLSRLPTAESPGKRASSMHDISSCCTSLSGVKQMCKYFEKKSDNSASITSTITATTTTMTPSSGYIKLNSVRLISSDSTLHNHHHTWNSNIYGLRC